MKDAKPYAKLANKVRVILQVFFLEHLEEFPCTGAGDGAQCFNCLLLRHTYAVVAYGQRTGIFIDGYSDLPLPVIFLNLLIGKRFITCPVNRVGGV